MIVTYSHLSSLPVNAFLSVCASPSSDSCASRNALHGCSLARGAGTLVPRPSTSSRLCAPWASVRDGPRLPHSRRGGDPSDLEPMARAKAMCTHFAGSKSTGLGLEGSKMEAAAALVAVGAAGRVVKRERVAPALPTRAARDGESVSEL